MKITFYKGLLKNLAGEILQGRREYLSKDKAYELLKAKTGMDFGCDVEKWAEWLKVVGRK